MRVMRNWKQIISTHIEVNDFIKHYIKFQSKKNPNSKHEALKSQLKILISQIDINVTFF